MRVVGLRQVVLWPVLVAKISLNKLLLDGKIVLSLMSDAQFLGSLKEFAVLNILKFWR